jgi:hypothetical protein
LGGSTDAVERWKASSEKGFQPVFLRPVGLAREVWRKKIAWHSPKAIPPLYSVVITLLLFKLPMLFTVFEHEESPNREREN